MQPPRNETSNSTLQALEIRGHEAESPNGSHNSITKLLLPRNIYFVRTKFSGRMIAKNVLIKTCNRPPVKSSTSGLLALLLLAVLLRATPACANTLAAQIMETAAPMTGLVFHEVAYDAKVTDGEGRFLVDITAESMSKQEVSQILFDGELALMPPKLPAALRIEREGNQYKLFVSKPGRYQLKVELVAKVHHSEPWNQVSFKGPSAAIA